MTERLYLDRPDVYMVADCDSREGGQARFVVCEHPAGADYAARLAASLGLPLRYGSADGDPEEDAPPPGPGRQRPGRQRPTATALAAAPVAPPSPPADRPARLGPASQAAIRSAPAPGPALRLEQAAAAGPPAPAAA